MANVAINRETGEILVVGPDGQWSPAQRAVNPQTGEQLYNDGSRWLAVPAAPQPERTAGESLARGTGLAARSLGPIIAGAGAGAAGGALIGGVGAVPGAIAGATSAALAQPLSDLAVSAYNYFAGKQQPTPSQAMESGMTQMGLPQPESAGERLASTALRAGVDAMTGVRTARMVADALPMTSQVARPVMETLAQNPVVANPRIPFTNKSMQLGAQETSAVLGGLSAQGAIEAGANPLAALALGGAAGSLPFLARPQNLLPNMSNDVRRGNVQTLQEAGIPITPAQELYNPFANVMESVMRYLPTSAAKVAGVEDKQMRAWTKAVNKQFGLDSDIATPEVLDAYQRAWGQRADTLERATALRPDDTFVQELGGMRQQFTRGLDDANFRLFEDKLNRVAEFVAARSQGAEIPGQNFRVIDSELRAEINASKNSANAADREYARALERLQTSFYGLMERSAKSTKLLPNGQPVDFNLAEAWKNLNRDYARFARVREAMGGAAGGSDKLNTGFIPAKALAQAERASIGPEAYATSSDPFTQLIRSGEAVIPNPTPNSGTAQRSFAQDLITGGKRGAPAVGAAGAAEAAGISLLDPTLALTIPYAVSRAWYAPRLPGDVQGLLAARSIEATNKARKKD
jgi:hypothetical protein